MWAKIGEIWIFGKNPRADKYLQKPRYAVARWSKDYISTTVIQDLTLLSIKDFEFHQKFQIKHYAIHIELLSTSYTSPNLNIANRDYISSAVIQDLTLLLIKGFEFHQKFKKIIFQAKFKFYPYHRLLIFLGITYLQRSFKT